jgi:hypothetical protein
VSLLVWCETHPNYRGVRPSPTDCEACNALWENERAERDYYDRMGELVERELT